MRQRHANAFLSRYAPRRTWETAPSRKRAQGFTRYSCTTAPTAGQAGVEQLRIPSTASTSRNSPVTVPASSTGSWLQPLTSISRSQSLRGHAEGARPPNDHSPNIARPANPRNPTQAYRLRAVPGCIGPAGPQEIPRVGCVGSLPAVELPGPQLPHTHSWCPPSRGHTSLFDARVELRDLWQPRQASCSGDSEPPEPEPGEGRRVGLHHARPRPRARILDIEPPADEGWSVPAQSQPGIVGP